MPRATSAEIGSRKAMFTMTIPSSSGRSKGISSYLGVANIVYPLNPSDEDSVISITTPTCRYSPRSGAGRTTDPVNSIPGTRGFAPSLTVTRALAPGMNCGKRREEYKPTEKGRVPALGGRA